MALIRDKSGNIVGGSTGDLGSPSGAPVPRSGEFAAPTYDANSVINGKKVGAQGAADLNILPVRPSQNSYISSSDSAVQTERNTMNTVAGLSIPSPNAEASRRAYDDALKILDDENARQEELKNDAAVQINAQFDEAKGDAKASQAKETAANNTSLSRIGGYLGGSASGLGAMNNLSETHRKEIAALEVKRSAAITAANEAVNEKQFKIAQAKAQEAKDYIKQIEDRNQKFFDNVLSSTREQREAQSADIARGKDMSEFLSPVIAGMLGEDQDANSTFITNTAREYGVDPNRLMAGVDKYQREQREKELAGYTSDIKNYNYARSSGAFSGSFTDYLKYDANLKSVAASSAEIGSTLGLAPDDPIYFATVGVNSDVVRRSYISTYANMKKAGLDAKADDFVDRLIYQSLPAAQKGEFLQYTQALKTGSKALDNLEAFKGANFGPYKTAIESVKPLAVLEKDQKWVNVVSQFEAAQAQIRRAFFGTAVTDAEKGTADGFLIDKNIDDVETAKTKLRNLIDYVGSYKQSVFDIGMGNYDAPVDSSGKTADDIFRADALSKGYSAEEIEKFLAEKKQ